MNEIRNKTIAKINEIKAGSLRRKTKLISLWPDSSIKTGRGCKSIKLEIKKMLQVTQQKYKGS